MRKKELLNQNMALFEQLQKAKLEIASLKKEISLKDAEILNLRKTKNSDDYKTDIVKEIEQNVANAVEIPSDVEYGAEIIGKVVVCATEYSNRLTSDGDTRYRELVNLILGKTEVAKSDILSVVSSNVGFDEKKEKINKIKDDTVEYFNSVMAQID